MKNYHVDPATGSDERGDGSPARPWATVQHAVDQVGHVPRGDYVIVQDLRTPDER